MILTLGDRCNLSCDDSNGKPPFAGSQLEQRAEYAKALGEPELTQLHSFAVTGDAHGSAEGERRVAMPSCECLVGDDMTAEGAVPPPASDKYKGTCMEWDGSCVECQRGIDRRCAGGGGPWCNSPCVFLSESICSGGQCHQCQPLSWVKESCPGKFCGNATACKNGTCAGTCNVEVPPPPPLPVAPSVNTTSLWLGTTDLRPAAGRVSNLTTGVNRCECVFTRHFASGTRAFYNATTWRTGSEASGAVASSSASCVFWSDNTTLDSAGGCAEARAVKWHKSDDEDGGVPHHASTLDGEWVGTQTCAAGCHDGEHIVEHFTLSWASGSGVFIRTDDGQREHDTISATELRDDFASGHVHVLNARARTAAALRGSFILQANATSAYGAWVSVGTKKMFSWDFSRHVGPPPPTPPPAPPRPPPGVVVFDNAHYPTCCSAKTPGVCMFRIPVVLHVPNSSIVMAWAEARLGANMGPKGCSDGSGPGLAMRRSSDRFVNILYTQPSL